MEYYFHQLLNLHDVIDVMHTEILTAEPLITEPSCFVVEIPI